MTTSTHGFCVELSLACPACRNPVPVNGLTEALPCRRCGELVTVPLEVWKAFFDSENVMEVLALERGRGQGWTMLGHYELQGKLHHLPARCGACKTDVPVGELSALAELGVHRCACGTERTVRAAPVWSRAVFPGARWVVGEHLTSPDDGTGGATHPVLFACMGCGGSLRVDGSSRTVRCSYCDDENFLPDALWHRLHPTPRILEFFVVASVPDQLVARAEASRDDDDDDDDHAIQLLRWAELPPELLDRMSQSEDDELRQGAAVSRSLPRETMARLAQDEEWEVRAALAANPSVDRATLERLAADDDSDVRTAVARRQGVSPDLLEKLLQDNDWEIRQAVMRNPATPPHAVAARAEQERDSDVLRALGARSDLDASVLNSLARNSDSDARAVAAAHPDTPPEALAAMAEDAWGEVARMLASHPSTPPQALTRLAERRADEVLAVLATREDLPRSLLLSLGRAEEPELAQAARDNPAWAPARKAVLRTRLLIAAAIAVLLLLALGVVLLLGGLGILLA